MRLVFLQHRDIRIPPLPPNEGDPRAPGQPPGTQPGVVLYNLLVSDQLKAQPRVVKNKT